MLLTALLASCLAQSAPPTVEHFQLANGMTWLLLPRETDTRVAARVLVKAGSVDEPEGQSGVAHFLEHLAFKGTPVVGTAHEWRLEQPLLARVLELAEALARLDRKGGDAPQRRALETEYLQAEREWMAQADLGAYWRAMLTREISINARTSFDWTEYEARLPSAQLRFWLAAEAQRFAAPVWREFRTERSVVLQELRDRATPDAPARELLRRSAFENGYVTDIGGLEREVRAIAPSSVDRFYEEHYAPGNAIGVLVGPFDPRAARRWIEDTFGALPPRDFKPRAVVRARTPRRVSMPCTTPLVLLGFPMSALDSGRAAVEESALELVLHTLEHTDPSIVVRSRLEGSEQAHLLAVTLTSPDGRTSAALERAWFDAWKATRVTEGAMSAAQQLRRRTFLEGLDDGFSLSHALAVSWARDGDCQRCFAEPRLDADELRAALERFSPDALWVVECQP